MKQVFVVAGSLLAGAAGAALLLHFASPQGAKDADDAPKKEAARPEAEDGALHLDADKAKAAGIKLAPLAGAVLSGQQQGYARALDLSPLAAIAAEITAAQAALAASGAEAQRLGALAAQDANASRREAEAAAAQASADRARLTLACQRVGLEFGPALARLGCGAIPALARQAAAGQRALLRIDMPQGAPPAGSTVEVGDGAEAMRLKVLGPAIGGDAQLQTAGVLALAEGAAAARASVGRVLPARIESAGGQAGVLVPRSAIVRADGALFAYRAAGKDGYERVALTGAIPAPQGWQVPAGTLHMGDRIAVEGAGTLLGLEHAAPAAGDE